MPRKTVAAPQPPPRLKAAPAGPRRPWEPYVFEPADASAVQALARGDANEAQQRRVLELVINKLACAYDMEFRPEGERDSAFAGGKRFVGLQVVKMLNINVTELVRRQDAVK